MEANNVVWIDVTNLMHVDFLTGIQRVVREVVIRILHMKNLKLNLVSYEEKRNAYVVLDNIKFYDYFKNHLGQRDNIYSRDLVQLTDFPSGSIFFDIDSVWNNRLKRSSFFPQLKQKGVKIVTMLHDLIPITHPQFCNENTCMNFMIYVGANIEYADLIIVSTQATADVLEQLCDKLEQPHKKYAVVPLGSDFYSSDTSKSGQRLVISGSVSSSNNRNELFRAIDLGLDKLSDNNCSNTNFMVYVNANTSEVNYIMASDKYIITSDQDTSKKICEALSSLDISDKKCIVTSSMRGTMANIDDSGSLDDENQDVSEEIKDIASGKYILMVGTIEPRKNHSLVIDALENGLADIDVKVIFAGRFGWNVADLEKRIKFHPLYNKKLFFIERPDDNTVDYLYKNATFVAFPTFNEGFGLPLVEAICHGTPVIASDIAVLREIGGDYVDYFDPESCESFVKTAKRLLCDERYYIEKKSKLTNYVPFTWDQSADLFAKAIMSVNENMMQVSNDIVVKQLVVLTARNDDILSTLPYLEKYMPFVTEIVICCPDNNVDELREKYSGRFTLKFLTDCEIIDGKALPEDHATRNYFLRCLMMKKAVIDDVFIMTDDDYRPLRQISVSDFVRDGRYVAYYCHDLNEWGGTYANPTSFDVGMKKSRKFLSEHGYPTMMYSSHQPQIIDKRIFNEMTEKYPNVIDSGLCEWCTYFNYGVGTYPDMFEVVPYISMSWPGANTDWKLYTVPKEFAFENHYSELYSPNRIFHDIPDGIENDSFEVIGQKIYRYMNDIEMQMSARKVYDDYCRSYRDKFKEMPSFTVVLSIDGSKVLISAPEFIKLKAGCVTRIEVTIDERIVEKAKGADMSLDYWFTDSNGKFLFDVRKQSIDKNELRFLLPVRTPNQKAQCQFNMVYCINGTNLSGMIKIKSEIV